MPLLPSTLLHLGKFYIMDLVEKSRNSYVGKIQKWSRMLCIEGPRGLVSFAKILTPFAAPIQVWSVSDLKTVLMIKHGQNWPGNRT